jgi:hypothetical protein
VDGGDRLQIQRVAEGVLDRKLQTPDKGWSFSLGDVQGNSSILVWLQGLANGGLCAYIGRIGG